LPLRRGSSREVISSNIEQLMRDYEETGKIGNVKPRNKRHAAKIASAIAYQKAGKSRKRKKK